MLEPSLAAMISYNVIIGDTITKIVLRIGGSKAPPYLPFVDFFNTSNMGMDKFVVPNKHRLANYQYRGSKSMT